MGKIDNDFNPDRLEWCLNRQRELGYVPREDISPLAYIGDNVKYGKCLRVKPFACIGMKGFSFAYREDGTPEEMVHAGGVIIGDYVEVGALTTIACSTLEDTIIGNYVKMDDHVHVGHNSILGNNITLTAGVILGGGVKIGDNAWLGLNCTIKNKVIIGEWAVVGSGAMVIKDVPPYAVVAGCPAKILRYRNES